MTDHDEQDAAEALDSDKIDDERDEALGQLSYPPEHPLGVDDPTADDWVTDSAVAREDRLEPDAFHDLKADYAAPDGEGPDLSEQLAGRVGRLVEPGAEDDAIFPEDVEAQAIGWGVDETDLDLSAEESAMHLEGE